MTFIVLIYGMVGATAGLLAGLLGIGGGMVIVPMLLFGFSFQGFSPDILMHMALGTSLASIVFTSVSSFYSHHRRGSVQWEIVRRITPGLLLGSFLGASLASKLPSMFLKIFFVAFLFFMAVKIFRGGNPKPHRQVPGYAGLFAAGNIIGSISSFAGMGGGSLSVPFMLWCNVPIHNAIGTSAAIGFPIAVSGALGYLANGLSLENLPPLTLGYIYIPALVSIVSCSVLAAPLGVRLAHRLPVEKLRLVFAIFLVVVAFRMLMTIL